MRFIKKVILGIILISIALIAVANRQLVTLQLVPDQLAPLLPIGNSYTLPLFLVILAAIVVGIFIGYLIEYIRERKHRRSAATSRREVSKLESEVANLKKKSGEQEDEILALLN
jgi:uncharacterized integral membrane protein